MVGGFLFTLSLLLLVYSKAKDDNGTASSHLWSFSICFSSYCVNPELTLL